MRITSIHHIAIIASDYKKSKTFYTEVLGLRILKETYREERDSYKLDLALGDQYLIELFSFPQHVPRSSRPEATGLRHLAFSVANVEEAVGELRTKNVPVEDIRIDEITGKKFTFFSDPDHLPLELYEA
ncbi:SMU1112c/YaeR family gloxylase I-like metalloprotein [Sphingobacterium pedocola]|uniref:VOC family protein n=1 Tax=Sphingobacterium pedocola TaxID=2082722 RepID=A0ABR9T572_9SPHI|nr:VOC family protein [Sphingobacterium pedocola]MBE8720495.1 VOC family protein [Sphingobacterium pedocola]